MAIYREGFHAVETIQKQAIRIYDDACDFGVPVKKNDANWNLAKMLFTMYGDKETRQQHNYSTGTNVYTFFTLIDEWAVSDERKTLKEATETYSLCYTTCRTGKCAGYDGFISIRKIK
jgi:hypothetical protein